MFLIEWQTDATKELVFKIPAVSLDEATTTLKTLSSYHMHLNDIGLIQCPFSYVFKVYNHLRGEYEEWIDLSTGITDPLELFEFLEGT